MGISIFLLTIYGLCAFILLLVYGIHMLSYLNEAFPSDEVDKLLRKKRENYYSDPPQYNLDDFIKLLYIVILWPIWVLYLYFKFGIKPTIKFIYKFILFSIKFVIYPFKFIYSKLIKRNKQCREPFKDKLGKFIVKVFKL